tara:strand:- start:78 stop:572 length:495 start_codon:yes stop_codon:yes gene_type:complete
MSKISFNEKQTFRQWWIWLLILIAPTVCLALLIQQAFFEKPLGINQQGDFLLLILTVTLGAVFPLLFYIIQLETKVNSEGILLKFRPFHINWIKLDFNEIKMAESTKYKPLMDYGGWGIRYGKNGKAYNVSGDRGVLLTLKNGSRVMIGSGDVDSLYSAINENL